MKGRFGEGEEGAEDLGARAGPGGEACEKGRSASEGGEEERRRGGGGPWRYCHSGFSQRSIVLRWSWT